MKVAVWDTFVNRNDGNGIMHFDILVPEEFVDATEIRKYGNEYLKDKEFASDSILIDKCLFCHVEHVPQHLKQEINHFGYAIIELSNCE